MKVEKAVAGWLVTTPHAERAFTTKAEAQAWVAAATAVGVVAYGGGLRLATAAHQCEHKGCGTWLGADYFSDHRCNALGIGVVLCEPHADTLAKLDDVSFARLVESRLFFRE